MGAITHERKSYAPVEVGSLHLSSEEVISRQNFSGSKTTFLWGLFTFTDYWDFRNLIILLKILFNLE